MTIAAAAVVKKEAKEVAKEAVEAGAGRVANEAAEAAGNAVKEAGQEVIERAAKDLGAATPKPSSSLKKVSAAFLRQKGVDPHTLKEGLPGAVSRFDIFMDPISSPRGRD